MKRVRITKEGTVDNRHFNGGNHTQGRPQGAKNKMPVQLREKAAEAHIANGGIMPLDFMLMVLRANRATGGSGRNKWEYPVSWDDKKWAADRLLNCFTPKLTATTLKGTVQVLALPPEALKGLSETELLTMEKALGKIASGESSGYTNGHVNELDIDAAAYVEELGED